MKKKERLFSLFTLFWEKLETLILFRIIKQEAISKYVAPVNISWSLVIFK